MPKSDVWKYFDRDSKRCRECGVEVATKGNTTNLWNHLSNKHNIVYRRSQGNKASMAEEDVDDSDVGVLQTGDKQLHSESILARKWPRESVNKGESKMQRTIQSGFDRQSSFTNGGDRAQALDDAALYMVVKDRMPLNTTEKPGFVRFAKKAVPLWKPPSRNKLTTLMENKSKDLHSVVRGAMSQLPSVCLPADCWTDPHTTRGYLGVTTHFLIGTEMESAALGLIHLTEPHNSLYLAEKLECFCQEWALPVENVSFCVTDNAGNIGNAVKHVFGPNRHINCYDHTLNLVPKSALGSRKNNEGILVENVPRFPSLVKKMKDVVTYSHTSVNFADEIRRIQMEGYKKSEGTVLRLIQDVDTRWDSTYLMSDRFEKMSNIIAVAGNKFPNVKILSAMELAEVRSTNELLYHFHEDTKSMSSGSVVTASKAIPISRLLRKAVSKVVVPADCPIATKLQKYLLAELDRRFGAQEEVTPLAAATILDPRFKKLHFTSPAALAKVLTFLSREFKKLVDKENSSRAALAAQAATAAATPDQPNQEQSNVRTSFWDVRDSEVATIHSTSTVVEDFAGGIPIEHRQYLNHPPVPRNSNPFEEWETMRLEYPIVYLLSRKFLPALSASTPSERLFSQVGLTATDLRNRLTPSHLSQRTFLASVSDVIWYYSLKWS